MEIGLDRLIRHIERSVSCLTVKLQRLRIVQHDIGGGGEAAVGFVQHEAG